MLEFPLSPLEVPPRRAEREGLTARPPTVRPPVADGRFEIARGEVQQPVAIIETEASTLAALVYGDRQLAEAVCSGDLQIEGDWSAVERFLGLFSLPKLAPPA
jgi:hypothetical protein